MAQPLTAIYDANILCSKWAAYTNSMANHKAKRPCVTIRRPLVSRPMRERKHYRHAPITQALIDIQVKGNNLIDLAGLASLPPEIRTGYPVILPVFTGNATISMTPGDSPKFEAKQIGYSMTGAEDHRYVIQARLDGLTVSRIAPYETWESLRDEFMRIWRWYEGITKPGSIVRLAVRYTNRLDLPLPFQDFKEYLYTTPEIGIGLPASLSGFVMQLQIPVPNFPGMIVLNEAMVPPARDGAASIVLDIDVFQTENIPYNFIEQLGLLHDQENAFFEGSITDKTRELIK